MNNFSKRKINPIDLMNALWVNIDLSHVEFDPDLRKGQYDIIQQSQHDGTALFTLQLMEKTLIHLVNRTSYCRPGIQSRTMKYRIGWVRHTCVFGEISLPYSDSPVFGKKERMRIAVVCFDP